MYLSISRRFEFCASHKYGVPDWSAEKNFETFGPEAKGRYGHGHNYAAYFILHGPVDPQSGMMLNLLHVKGKIAPVIDGRFDHKFLNLDTPPFNEIQPTPENLAQQLLDEVQPIFSDDHVTPVVCHLRESPTRAATAYHSGRIESDLWMDFSAARRTYSPHLSDAENRELFGRASAVGGSGHHFRLRVTLQGDIDPHTGMIVPDQISRTVLCNLRGELNHRNLDDIPFLSGQPQTTEILALYIWRKLKPELPMSRVCLYDSGGFFVEYHGNNEFVLGLAAQFHAAHRLHSPNLTDRENEELYGVCGNPNGHGHLFDVECTLCGSLDERSGTLQNVGGLSAELADILEEWDYKHLNLEVPEFGNQASTGENIVRSLWRKLDPRVDGNLQRLRLLETVNNRFSLRREIG